MRARERAGARARASGRGRQGEGEGEERSNSSLPYFGDRVDHIYALAGTRGATHQHHSVAFDQRRDEERDLRVG